MGKCMISQPMRGLTDDEIIKVRDKALIEIQKLGYEAISPFIPIDDKSSDDNLNMPLYQLGRSLMIMAECEAVYFCKGWDDARGCEIENTTAKKYGLKCIYE